MSNKKHKGDHGSRAERHAAKKNQATLKNPASAEKPNRVFLRNWVYIWATAGVMAAAAAVLIGLELLDGYKRIRVTPHALGVEHLHIDLPTPYGTLIIDVHNGIADISAPAGITIDV